MQTICYHTDMLFSIWQRRNYEWYCCLLFQTVGMTNRPFSRSSTLDTNRDAPWPRLNISIYSKVSLIWTKLPVVSFWFGSFIPSIHNSINAGWRVLLSFKLPPKKKKGSWSLTLKLRPPYEANTQRYATWVRVSMLMESGFESECCRSVLKFSSFTHM